MTTIEMTVRAYRDADMPGLQDAFASWIAEAGRTGYDHIGELPARINEHLRGRRPVGELVHLWEADGRIAGLAICLRFGQAFDVFTAPSLRGTPAEVRMLQSAARTTARCMGGAKTGSHVLTEVFGDDDERVRLLTPLTPLSGGVSTRSPSARRSPCTPAAERGFPPAGTDRRATRR